MNKLVLIVFFLMQSLVVFAHQDRLIMLEAGERLTGLPEHYSNPIFEHDTFTLY